MPWRQLGVLALLLILVAGAVAVYVGSQQQTTRPAPPFGLAANGKVLYVKAGDIFVADPVTGDEQAIVTGPENDRGPVWSPDGTKLAFVRQDRLYVVREDGQGLTQVTPTAISGLDSWSFSPDGRSIASFASGEDGLSIMVVPSDGSAEPKLFPVPATTGDGPPLYRPDGTDIMFIGVEAGAESRSVFALDPATGATRTLIAPPASMDISGALWSSDGSRISYNMHDTTTEVFSNRAHVASSDGSGGTTVDGEPNTLGDLAGPWSNDGTRMVINRWYEGDPYRVTTAVVSVDRSTAAIELECPPGAPDDDCTADWVWSPDDTMLIGSREGGAQFIADPQTGKIRPAPWTAGGRPQMQRRAP
jgi:Tol biopolymer transport system component